MKNTIDGKPLTDALSDKHRINATISHVIDITRQMRRLVLGGPEVATWIASHTIREPDAWIRIFPPGCDSRAYTIRTVDQKGGTLGVEFFLHDDHYGRNSVSNWARSVKLGDMVSFVGPRNGSFQLQPQVSWVWLAADASALPAALSILERMPAAVRTYALCIVPNELERQKVPRRSNIRVDWRYELQPPEALELTDQVLLEVASLQGPGQVWIAGEANWMKSWRTFWADDEQLNRRNFSTKGYWKDGERDHRD